MANRLGNNNGRSYDYLVQPVRISCNFVVDSTNGNGLGIRNLKGSGVRNVFMHTTATPGVGAGGYLNPNPAAGYALVQLKEGYFRYDGGYSGFVSPTTGGTLAINGSALTVGQPYIIASVGAGPAGAVTIAPQADSAGSLAGSYFFLYDGYGNTYVMWIYVTGVGGSAPVGIGGIPVQVTIASGATAGNITTAISAVALALASNAPNGVQLPAGVAPFTSSGAGGATLTLTSTGGLTISGPPRAGVIAGTAWTFAQTVYNTNQVCWNGVGLPKGIVPAVGASFVASATGLSAGGGSTGLAVLPGVSGNLQIELVGDPNQTISAIPMGGSSNVGGYIMVQFLTPTVSAGAYDSPMVATAPANNSVCGMSFILESKSILIAGA